MSTFGTQALLVGGLFNATTALVHLACIAFGFWLVSSGIRLVIGLVHAYGVMAPWSAQ